MKLCDLLSTLDRSTASDQVAMVTDNTGDSQVQYQDTSRYHLILAPTLYRNLTGVTTPPTGVPGYLHHK